MVKENRGLTKLSKSCILNNGGGMDVVTALHTLEMFRRQWEKAKKNEVVSIAMRGHEATSFFIENSFYQVWVAVLVGPKLRLIEQCIIVDTREKKSDVDHLLMGEARSCSTCSRTFLNSSRDIQKAITSRDKMALRRAIEFWMTTELKLLQQNPDECLRRIVTLSR